MRASLTIDGVTHSVTDADVTAWDRTVAAWPGAPSLAFAEARFKGRKPKSPA
jgi:hypothetical protein